ncbi:MAG: tetratricopeptide repeat protein [Elainellaceae cyanobacterium]
MRDRHFELIDRIITATLKGKIRSKAQVYRMLKESIELGSGEIFERCLQERLDDVQTQLNVEDELKQAKAGRKQRALQTIQSEWERLQKENQENTFLLDLVQRLATLDEKERLTQFLQALDPNQGQILTREQLQQLIRLLDQKSDAPDDAANESSNVSELADLAAGLRQGLQVWQELDGNVVSWIFEQNQRSIGFSSIPSQRGPWSSWVKNVSDDFIRQIFQDLSLNQTVTAEGIPSPMSLSRWTALMLVLQRLNLGLISWFDQQPYDVRAGKRLSIATYLTFTVVWSQLSNRFIELNQQQLASGCFQMALQILSRFAQQPYFPLYGGLFAALSDETLQIAIEYLDQPLRQAPNTQSKARILTLLGYSQRALGDDDLALDFHEEALDIAREAGDRPCEIANLNHLSRTYVMVEDYEQAIDNGQRALILARQEGDRLGEANALANIGSSEVLLAQEENQLDPEQYERILDYLQRGLKLSEQTADRPSQALCANSLGVAQVVLGHYEEAIASLELGLHIASAIGDLFFQGLNFTYLAEAHRSLENVEQAVVAGCVGMYLLHQIDTDQWRQPAGIVSILHGQMGTDLFNSVLQKNRPHFLKQIGVDGYDFLPELIDEYQQSLEESFEDESLEDE